jgi:D-3-phosphoglycerate dehydrogenase
MGHTVYITRRIPQPAIDLLKSECDVDINPEDTAVAQTELLTKVKGKNGILCLLTDTIDEQVIEAADRAKVFANFAVGYDNIDVDAATRRGILVTNTPGVLTDTTAELAWALVFAAARRTAEADRFTREGRFVGWSPTLLLGQDITGKTLGVVGAGRIGTAFAEKSRGFRMKILYHDVEPNADFEKRTGGTYVSLETLLEQSDVISLHVPLTQTTLHLIGENELAKMKNTTILVNTSRGPVVDEQALAEALKNGQIAGAGLDVYEEEPKVHPALLTLDKVVLAPHIGSASVETRTKMAVMAAENLLAALRGEVPRNLVNPDALTKRR